MKDATKRREGPRSTSHGAGALSLSWLLLSLLLLPTAARAGMTEDDGQRGPSRETLLRRINAQRASRGRATLRLHLALNVVAQRRAEEIVSGEAEEDAFDKEILERLVKAGYRPQAVAEVVLESEGEPDRVLDGWPGSPTHENMLDERYRDAGIGIGIVEEDGDRVVVFLLALSAKDFFEKASADIRDLDRVRREMLARVNRERREARLPPLAASPALHRAAQSHAEDMARRSYYGHKSPEGKTVFDRAIAQGYEPLTAAENLASGPFSATEVMDGWMRSRAHRDNILRGLFTEAGFGVAVGELEGVPTVFWVQAFGRPKV